VKSADDLKSEETKQQEYYQQIYDDSTEYRQAQLQWLRRQLNDQDDGNLEESEMTREAIDKIELDGRMVW
jgi:hypothetical protein